MCLFLVVVVDCESSFFDSCALSFFEIQSNIFQSVYNNKWGGYMGAVMHELGHNFGIRHSYKNDKQYQGSVRMLAVLLRL